MCRLLLTACTAAALALPQAARGGRDLIVSYVGRVDVTFRTGAAQAGELTSGSLAHGGNTLRSSDFSPTEEETDQARRELAVAATRTAMAQARAVAEAAGERVLAVREINVGDSGGYVPPPPPSPAAFARVGAGAPAPVATQAGEQDVSVTVDVKTAIAPSPG